MRRAAFSMDGASLFYEAGIRHFGSRLGLLCVRSGAMANGVNRTVAVSGTYRDFLRGFRRTARRCTSGRRGRCGLQGAALRIWKVEKTEHGWGEPAVLPAPVNGPEGHGNWGLQLRGRHDLFASDRDPAGHCRFTGRP